MGVNGVNNTLRLRVERGCRTSRTFRSQRIEHGPSTDRKPTDPRWERMQEAMAHLLHDDRELIVLYHIERTPLETLASEWGVRLETLHLPSPNPSPSLDSTTAQAGE
jgi:DNA-directed RNA polymerase specialized sigma24 family protein